MNISFSHSEIWAFNSMITSLYQETNKEKAVQNFLSSLKQLCFFEKSDVYLYKIVNGKLRYDNLICAGWGEELSTYLRYRDLDDVIPIVSTVQSIVFRSSDIFIDAERSKTEYYRKVLEPCSMDYSIEGNLYYEPNGILSGFCLHRQKKYGDFSEKELEFVKLAKPHLSNYIMSGNEFSGHPTFLTRNDLNLHANTVAAWIFNDNFDVKKVDIGEKSCIKEDYEKIEAALQSICRNMNVAADKTNSIIDLSLRHNCKITIEDKSYYVEIVYISAYNKSGHYNCMVCDHITIIKNLLENLKDKYDFTEREFDILKYLYEGMSYAEISEKLFVSQPTIKKDAAVLYQKLDIDGRHQLFLAIK